MKGITRELTIWCGRCNHWHQEPVTSPSLKAFARCMMKAGWSRRRRSANPWMCPDCTKGTTPEYKVGNP